MNATLANYTSYVKLVKLSTNMAILMMTRTVAGYYMYLPMRYQYRFL